MAVEEMKSSPPVKWAYSQQSTIEREEKVECSRTVHVRAGNRSDLQDLRRDVQNRGSRSLMMA